MLAAVSVTWRGGGRLGDVVQNLEHVHFRLIAMVAMFAGPGRCTAFVAALVGCASDLSHNRQGMARLHRERHSGQFFGDRPKSLL